MKNSSRLLAGLLLIPLAPLHAEDLTTSDGQIYKNITVSGDKGDSIKVMHDGGIALIPKKDLPPAFAAAHHIAGASASPASLSPANAESAALLQKFVASTPTFSALNGKQFKSAEIRTVEPNAISLMTDNGPIRIKFTDLPDEVRQALHYDENKAAEFERNQAARSRAVADRGEVMANAASVVDKRPPHARLSLIQNDGKGWFCHMQFLREAEKSVVTAHQGSALSATTMPGRATAGRSGGAPVAVAPPTVYESHKVSETVVASDEGEVMVFGLPDYSRLKPDLQDHWQWSGNIYWIGMFERHKMTQGGFTQKEIVQAYMADRTKAIQLVATNGVERFYDREGQPRPDKVDPEAELRRQERAKVRTALDTGDFATAIEVLGPAQIEEHHDPAQLVEFQTKVVEGVRSHSRELAGSGEGWEAATGYVSKFLEPRFSLAIGELHTPLNALLNDLRRQGDKRMYDQLLKTKSSEDLDVYFLRAPVKAMLPEVAAYRRWLQNREAPRKLVCKLMKIEWSAASKRGLTGGTALKLYVDGVGDVRNDHNETYNRTGTTADEGGLRTVTLNNKSQSKKASVTVQVFHVTSLSAWEPLSTFSQEISLEQLHQQSGLEDAKGNKLTFEVNGVIKEPFLPPVCRVGQ